MSDAIPFGQPILVGHHSEGRDRRFRKRITAKFDKGVESLKRAGELERRAAAVGKAGISSDDPDAVTKLRAQVVDLEAFQEMMKATNRLVRRNDREGLAAMGFDERRVAALFTPDFCGRLGFPSYAVTNNGANIRRIKQRIAELEQLTQTPAMESIVGDGWTIREDVSENRVIIEFDAKPSREILDQLRAYGFKWSPTRGAHVRMRSNGAWFWAKRILGVVD